MHATVSTPRSEQRTRSGRKQGKNQPRHENGFALWRRSREQMDRIRRESPDNWFSMIPNALNESHGSPIGRLWMDQKITTFEADAGRNYAMLAAQYDKYHNISRRVPNSPAYDRAYGRDDEIARREREGSISSYEKRAKRIRKKWRKVNEKLPIECQRALIHVCVENRDPEFGEMPALKSALAILAKPRSSYSHKIVTAHTEGGKLGNRGSATWTRKRVRRKTAETPET